jgi:hypothetical protein
MAWSHKRQVCTDEIGQVYKSLSYVDVLRSREFVEIHYYS